MYKLRNSPKDSDDLFIGFDKVVEGEKISWLLTKTETVNTMLELCLKMSSVLQSIKRSYLRFRIYININKKQ